MILKEDDQIFNYSQVHSPTIPNQNTNKETKSEIIQLMILKIGEGAKSGTNTYARYC